MKVWKDILCPGKYTLPDGRVVEYTAADCRNAYRQGQRMLSDGLAVPVILEHDFAAVPVELSYAAMNPEWPSSFARNAIGHVEGYQLRGNVLWSLNEIPDDEAARQWKRCRYASPRIDRDFEASNGKVYSGPVVSHLAVTPKPVQWDQAPVMLSRKVRNAPVFLSLSYRSGAMADESETTTETEGNAGGSVTKLKDLLSQAGFPMPDGVNDLDAICIALEAQVMVKDGGSMEDDDMDMDDTEGNTDATTTANNNPSVMMSAQVKKAEGKVMAAVKGDLKRRAERVSARLMSAGLMDRPTATELIREVTGANLSLTDAGDVARNTAITKLEAYESIAKAKKLGRAKGGNDAEFLSATAAVTTPHLGRGTSPEGVSKATDLMMSRMRGAPAKPKT
jgi:hypothetical protein